MNKLNPASIAEAFQNEIDQLLAYYDRATNALRGSPTEGGDISMLNEQVFLSAAVLFESTLSDLYFAYVNKDSSLFIAAKEQKIKDSLTETFGTWYASKISIPHLKHIKADELYTLLDPRGYNITFQNARNMVAQAKKNLLPAYANKYKAITPHQRKLADCVKYVRNYVAHRSDSGFASMTKALSSLSTGPYASLSRSSSRRVNSVGAYLKSWTGAESRTQLYLKEMCALVNAIGR
jgi:hypothetical protein